MAVTLCNVFVRLLCTTFCILIEYSSNARESFKSSIQLKEGKQSQVVLLGYKTNQSAIFMDICADVGSVICSLFLQYFKPIFDNSKALCSDSESKSECQPPPPVFCNISPSIILQQNSQNRAVLSVLSCQIKCHSPELQVLGISCFVFTSYLHKSQNIILLRGVSTLACFKCKTNKFLTQVLGIRFQ